MKSLTQIKMIVLFTVIIYGCDMSVDLSGMFNGGRSYYFYRAEAEIKNQNGARIRTGQNKPAGQLARVLEAQQDLPALQKDVRLKMISTNGTILISLYDKSSPFTEWKYPTFEFKCKMH